MFTHTGDLAAVWRGAGPGVPAIPDPQHQCTVVVSISTQLAHSSKATDLTASVVIFPHSFCLNITKNVVEKFLKKYISDYGFNLNGIQNDLPCTSGYGSVVFGSIVV